MRDRDRITMIVTKLKELWRGYPDLRFWQLVEMLRAWTGVEDPFDLEDDEIDRILSERIAAL